MNTELTNQRCPVASSAVLCPVDLFPPDATKPNWDDLPKERFDANWRCVTTVQECGVTDLSGMIAAHYLRKRPAVVVLCLMMRVKAAPAGCVIFAEPPPEVNKRYGGVTWELARLYLLDEVPRNGETWLIGQSVRWIKNHCPTVTFLVSYADPSAGHSGTIYKASNWRADGRTDDERVSPRCDYHDTKTGQKYGRQGNIPPGATVERKPRVSKWRFVMQIRKGHNEKLRDRTVENQKP